MPATIPDIFERGTLRRQRDGAADGFSEFDFLKREISDRLADRLRDISREFKIAVDLGCHTGVMAEYLDGLGGIETLIQCDLSERMVASVQGANRIVVDEEALPFADSSLNLVMAAMNLHWVNDLPGTFAQIRRALRPDGLFLAATFGLGTLAELRDCLMRADLELRGGAGPRVSPFIDTREAGALLQRAGFALPVVDTDTITVTYENIFKLMADLRGMGEANLVKERPRSFTPRSVFLRAGEIYAEEYADPDGRIPATFEIAYLTGWAPDQSQQKPLRPGSATSRLADALGTSEVPAGEAPE